MGGVLPEPRRPEAAGAGFRRLGTRRPGDARERPGGLLQRIQIIKGWVGDDGLFHQEVHEVAG